MIVMKNAFHLFNGCVHKHPSRTGPYPDRLRDIGRGLNSRSYPVSGVSPTGI